MIIYLKKIISGILSTYNNNAVPASTIISVLIMVCFVAAYEFFVYRVVSHRAFYNKSFNISITVLPFFISTIILCLQSNVVITLGTIGALAIIRYRTAIKDPVDMVYLLWSVHTGICCGCQLYEVSVLTSIAVTAVLLLLNYINIGHSPYCLILHCSTTNEKRVINLITQNVKNPRIKNRNYTSSGIDMVVEFFSKNPVVVSEILSASDAVDKFSIIEYDAEDII